MNNTPENINNTPVNAPDNAPCSAPNNTPNSTPNFYGNQPQYPPQYAHYYGVQSEQSVPKKKNLYNIYHGIFALIAFVVGSLWFRWIFVEESIANAPKTVSVTVFALIFSVFVYGFFKLQKAKFSADNYFLLALLIIFSLRFSIYTEDYSQITTLSYLVLHLTALLLLFSFGKEKSLDNIVGSAFRSVLVSPFASFHTVFASLSVFLKLRKKTPDSKEKVKRFGNNLGLVLLGILVALPLILIVIPLLITDSFFSTFMGDIGEFLANIDINFDIGEYFNFITILVSMYIFGALYSADKKRTEEPSAPTNYRFIPSLIGKTIIISLLAVYALFIIAQIDGFACMFMGRLPDNTTYAEFARSGFFELCTVACINGALLYYLNIMTLNEENKKSKNLLQIILVSVTFFLIFTAAFKMIMYISAYGYTPKRFYTLWFMLLLTVIFALTLVKLKKPDFKLSRYCVYVSAAMLLVLFFINFEGISESLNEVYFPEEITSR